MWGLAVLRSDLKSLKARGIDVSFTALVMLLHLTQIFWHPACPKKSSQKK
jgi:hypothetical protein